MLSTQSMQSALTVPPDSLVVADHASAPGWTADAIARLEALLPAAVTGPRTIVACAQAYVESFCDDVVRLEHERAVLAAALGWAWQRDDYAAVTRLAAGLSMIAGRIGSDEAEFILRLGIRASRLTGDRRQHTLLLNRFACVLFVQGKYWQARRLWYASLRLSEGSHAALGIWKPLASFAYIIDLLLHREEAQQFADAILRARQSDDERTDAERLALAYFVRGFYARIMGDLGAAQQDFGACLRLLATPACSCATPGATTGATPANQLFTLVVLTELARAQRDVSRAQSYGASAATLAQVYGDHHTAYAIASDMTRYNAEYRQVVTPLREVAAFPESRLTRRERELLALVAEGLSNQQIAARLVITVGAVKKHLEHIYTKFAVSSRTAAVARARRLALLP